MNPSSTSHHFLLPTPLSMLWPRSVLREWPQSSNGSTTWNLLKMQNLRPYPRLNERSLAICIVPRCSRVMTTGLVYWTTSAPQASCVLDTSCHYTGCPLCPQVFPPLHFSFKSHLKFSPSINHFLTRALPPGLLWKLVRTSIIYLHAAFPFSSWLTCLPLQKPASTTR